MEIFVRTLLRLLKRKDLVSPDDLVLPWRPLYLLLEDLSSHYVSLNLKVYPPDFEKNLKNLIKICRYFFPPSATEEILAEFRPNFCPHDAVMTRAVSYCTLFLPTLHVRRGQDGTWSRTEPAPYLGWYRELLSFWSACSNTPAWEGNLLNLMSRLAMDNIGCIDWSNVTPVFFQKFMHSFGLPVFYKRLGVGLKTSQMSSSGIARWIVSSISKEQNYYICSFPRPGILEL